MPSIITALAVLGATVLPDGADAAIPNGWVATATLPDDGASTFDPTKIVLTVQDPGYDNSGTLLLAGLGGPVRTIRGTAVVRKQYANNTQRLNSASGGTRTVYFALSDFIYAGSVVASADAEAGYYGAAAAGSIAGLSNGSSLAYPRPQWGWGNLQHERATGSSFAVEGFAFHEHARGGQQVACVQLQGRDAQGTPNLTAVQTVGAPALSSLQTQGNIAEAWKATIPLTALTQGDLAQVNAKVFPWIGDATAVLDTSDATKGAAGTLTAGSHVDVAQGQTPLRFVVDKTGGYGGNTAYVKVGASGGTVGSSSTPFPTVTAALTALQAANNSGKGHNDHSGSTIYLMETSGGAGADHAMSATTASAGKCWTEIRVDPAATGTVRLTLAGNLNSVSDLINFRCPIYVNSTGAVTLNGGSGSNLNRIGFDGASVTYNVTGQSTGFCIQFGLKYYRNVAMVNVASPFYPFTGATREMNALILGCTGTIAGTKRLVPNTCVGNTLEGATIYENDSTTALSIDGGILYNNRFLKQQASNLLAQTKALSGFARVQNVFEMAGISNSAAWGIANDNTTVALSGFLSMFNTLPGVGAASSNIGRQNAAYADVTGAAGVQKRMVEKFDLLHQRNTKGDTFTGTTPGTVTNTGRTGTWAYRYGAGQIGLVVVTGDAQAGLSSAPDQSGAGTNGNWTGEALDPSSTIVAGEANVTFTSNLSGTAGAGGGTYALTGLTNAAYNRVPAGRAPLKYDIAGVARRNDGTGAAGAHENTSNPPISGAGGASVPAPGGSGTGGVAVGGGGGTSIPAPGASGTGGLTPIAGGGGASIGAPQASGTGEVVQAAITATGEIIASADRMLAVEAVPSGGLNVVALPLQAAAWAAPFDPSDRAPYAIDWSDLLADGEAIEQIDKITMSAQGASVGVKVDTDDDRTPIISEDGTKTQLWFVCDAAFQQNAAFAGAGVQVGVSLLIRTDADPYKQFERTGVVTVRQQ
jgi:hypothetical protein